MPKYRITAPDGKTYEVNAPDGASQDDVLNYVKQNYQGAAQQSQPQADPQASFQAINAQNVADSSGWDNFWAGVGKSAVDTGRGLEQLSAGLGSLLPSSIGGDYYSNAYHQLKDQQSEANNLDAALMHSKSGLAGNITGQALQAIAGGTALKGAGLVGSVAPSGYAGAAMSGGAQGLLQPLSADQSELSRLKNVALGAGAGVLGQGAVNLGGAAYRGGKALLSPFFDSGQDRIVANTLSRFGGDAAKGATPSAIPGVNASLAEQTGDAGIAQLQRAVMDSDPAIAAKFASQRMQNNASRLGLLQDAAGSADDVASARAARAAEANDLYGQAASFDADRQSFLRAAQQKAKSLTGAAGADVANDAAIQPSQQLLSLANRPAIKSAMAKAQELAANNGIQLGNPLNSVQGLHYTKLALDDALNVGAQQGIGNTEKAAITGARDQLVNELEKISPFYAQAKNAYKEASAPINQMEILQGLLGKATTNTEDQLGNQVLQPTRYANALSQLDAIAQKVTGQKGASASNILTPDQSGLLGSLKTDLNRQMIADQVGKSAGSNTVQNLASQNLLGEVANGIGLPGLANSGLLGRLTTPLSKAYNLFGAPDQIKERLANVLLNPQSPEAQAILRKMTPAQRSALANYAASAGGLIGQSARLGIGQQAPLQR